MTAPAEAEVVGAQQTLIAAGALLDRPVHDKAGTKLGKVVEVMLVAGRGEIAYVVVGVGGVLGFGERLHALPWPEFVVDPWNGRLTVDAASVTGPGFDKDHWPVSA